MEWILGVKGVIVQILPLGLLFIQHKISLDELMLKAAFCPSQQFFSNFGMFS